MLGLATDKFREVFAKIMGGDHEFAVAGRRHGTGQFVEQGCDISAQFLITAENAQVFVNSGSAGVVVAGSDMDIAANAIRLLANAFAKFVQINVILC